MNNTAVEQEQLFNDIIAMKQRLQHLGAYVQNDFDRMLADGTTTKGYIGSSAFLMGKDFDQFQQDLTNWHMRARKLMTDIAYDKK